MWLVLHAVGIPPKVIRALKSLYSDNRHYFVFGGRYLQAFCGAAGVRQGCPASTSLFLIATDPIIRALCLRILRPCTIRAYADDIALVLTHIWKHAPTVAALFLEVAKFSMLCLKPKNASLYCCGSLRSRPAVICCSNMFPPGATSKFLQRGSTWAFYWTGSER